MESGRPNITSKQEFSYAGSGKAGDLMTGLWDETSFAYRFIRHLVVIVSVSFVVYLASVQAWESYEISVGYRAVLAFLTIECASASLFQSREDSSPIPVLFVSFFVFSSIDSMIGSAEQLFSASSPLGLQSAARTASDLAVLSILGVLLLITSSLNHRLADKRKPTLYRITVSILILCLAVQGVIQYIILAMSWAVMVSGFVFGLVALVTLTVSGVQLSKVVHYPHQTDRVRLLLGPVVLGLSAIPLLFSLIWPSAVWTMSMTLQLAGFFLLYLAQAMPMLRSTSLGRAKSYAVAFTVSMLVIAPLLVTVAAKVVMPTFHLVDFGAYTLSHVGISALSSVMAFLVFSYSRRKPDKRYFPLILMFAIQALVEMGQIGIGQLSGVGETASFVAYIVGSVVVSIGLLLVIGWAGQPQDNESRLGVWLLKGFGVVFVISLIGQSIAFLLVTSISDMASSPLGQVILLSVNLGNVFGYTYLCFLLLKSSQGTFTVELTAVTFLALWIAPNILRSVFNEWSAGWWSAEVLLLLGLLAGPAFLGTLYMGSYLRAETSQKRATLYADILVHDIGNYHQAILSALELLDMKGVPPEVEENARAGALDALARASELTGSVRQLARADAAKSEQLVPVDLAACITDAVRQVAVRTPEIDAHIRFESEEHYYVDANSLLIDLFLNLFHNAIQYSPSEKRIDVEVSSIVFRGRNHWEVRVVDRGAGIAPEQKKKLFSRFMEGARGTGLGLSLVRTLTDAFGGDILVEDRVVGDFTKGTVFVVRLPVSVTSKFLKTRLKGGLERAIHAALTGLYPIVVIGSQAEVRFTIDMLRIYAAHRTDLRACYDITSSECQIGTCDIEGMPGGSSRGLPSHYVVVDFTSQSVTGGASCRACMDFLERTSSLPANDLRKVALEQVSQVLGNANELARILSEEEPSRSSDLAAWKTRLSPESREVALDVLQGQSGLGRFLREAGMVCPPSVLAGYDKQLIVVGDRVLPTGRPSQDDMSEILKRMAAAVKDLVGSEVYASIESKSGI
ncbi:MAG: hypothetical protein C4K49_07585 [Candidatus Thorarchaeota archaeon]|nr:MAG: hypothetical protein C4K49_07585 [Candidatus Thorarchaeota archaeon]